MGTWGAGGFENDVAADLAADLVAEVAAVEDLAAALDGLPDDPTAEIDADAAQQVIAAAECVAAMMGRASPDAPKDLLSRVPAFGDPTATLVAAAREAVSRVLGGCELTDLWAEADAGPFNRAMTSLIERLNPALPFDPPPKSETSAVRQTCGFCNDEIADEDLVSLEVRQIVDPINQLNKGFWCHLACLNERLHPGHLVQHWTFNPDEVERAAEDLLKE